MKREWGHTRWIHTKVSNDAENQKEAYTRDPQRIRNTENLEHEKRMGAYQMYTYESYLWCENNQKQAYTHDPHDIRNTENLRYSLKKIKIGREVRIFEYTLVTPSPKMRPQTAHVRTPATQPVPRSRPRTPRGPPEPQGSRQKPKTLQGLSFCNTASRK